MLRRYVCSAIFVLALGGFVLADTITGFLTEISDKEAKIVVGRKKGEKGEEKTFKVTDKTKFYKKTKDGKDDLKLDALKELVEKSKKKGVAVKAEEKDGTLTEIVVGAGKKKKKDAE